MTITQASSLVVVGNLTLRRVPGSRAAIRTDRSDMLTLVLPDETTEEQACEVVLRHYSAVSRWLRVGDAANAWDPIAKEFVGWEGFLLHGRSHRMRWQQPTCKHLAAFEPGENGIWLNIAPSLEADLHGTREAIKACYARETTTLVERRYGTYADRLGLGPATAVRADDNDSRWLGIRATRSGLALTAHWALAQFGIASVDYLICRVLCARAGRNIEVIYPDQYARGNMQCNARDVWTGRIARR